jgi:hypothetical protein
VDADRRPQNLHVIESSLVRQEKYGFRTKRFQ